MTEYRSTVFRLREQYAGRMDILLGLEWDSCAEVEPDGFDYRIGSVHYQRALGGAYYTTDWDDETFLLCLNEDDETLPAIRSWLWKRFTQRPPC